MTSAAVRTAQTRPYVDRAEVIAPLVGVPPQASRRVSPDSSPTESESPSADDADEPETSTTQEPEDKDSEQSPDTDDIGSEKRVSSSGSGGATAPGRAAASPAQ